MFELSARLWQYLYHANTHGVLFRGLGHLLTPTDVLVFLIILLLLFMTLFGVVIYLYGAITFLASSFTALFLIAFIIHYSNQPLPRGEEEYEHVHE